MTPEEAERLIDQQIDEMFPGDGEDDVERCANRIADALTSISLSLVAIAAMMLEQERKGI